VASDEIPLLVECLSGHWGSAIPFKIGTFLKETSVIVRTVCNPLLCSEASIHDSAWDVLRCVADLSNTERTFMDERSHIGAGAGKVTSP